MFFICLLYYFFFQILGLIYNKLTPSIEQINILKEHDIIDITDIGEFMFFFFNIFNML